MGIFQQFPYSNFHELNLDQIIKIMREIQDEWEATKAEWASYKDFIDNYFANLNVSNEVLNALRVLIGTGEFSDTVDPTIISAVNTWLNDNITPTTPAIDASLTIAGSGADARVTGLLLARNDSDVDFIEERLYLEPDITMSGVSPADSNANVIIPDINVESGKNYTYTVTLASASTAPAYAYLVDAQGNTISSVTIPAGNLTGTISFTGTRAYPNCVLKLNSSGVALNYTASFTCSDNNLIHPLKKANIANVLNMELTNSQIILPALGQPNKIILWFPVTSGKVYTVDKKRRTQYSRIGFTQTKPTGGTPVLYYDVLPVSDEYITFTAPMNGYACVKIFDETADITLNFHDVANTAIAYEGEYDRFTSIKSIGLYQADQAIFHCGPYREFSTLKDAIENAIQFKDATLYVDPGTYDIVAEFGDAYFANLNANSIMPGIKLGNGIHVIFSPNSKVICHYTGNNQYALTLFSPFNASTGGFTLENLNLDVSRCRYAIHDEYNSAAPFAKSHYINCQIKMDNTNNPDWHAFHCIGGGLGANTEVIIENCKFESADPTVRWGVFYHTPNQNITNYRSVLTVKDCYFKSGTVCLQGVTPQDSTTGNTQIIVCNNYIKYRYAGTNEEGVYNELTNSYELMNWNNVIGS